ASSTVMPRSVGKRTASRRATSWSLDDSKRTKRLLHCGDGRFRLGLRRRHITLRARRLGLLHETEGLAATGVRSSERAPGLDILTARHLHVLTTRRLPILTTRGLDLTRPRQRARRLDGVSLRASRTQHLLRLRDFSGHWVCASMVAVAKVTIGNALSRPAST